MARDVVLRIGSSGRLVPARRLVPAIGTSSIPAAYSVQAILALAQMMPTGRSRRRRRRNSQHSSLQGIPGALALIAAAGTQRRQSGRPVAFRSTVARATYATCKEGLRGRITWRPPISLPGRP